MPRHESTHPGALAAVTADAVAASATTTMSQHVEMHVTGRPPSDAPITVVEHPTGRSRTPSREVSQSSGADFRGLPGVPGADRTDAGAGACRMPSDRQLLERMPEDRGGATLKTLYRRYSQELYRFAYRGLGDPGAADELVQDVFTSVWRHAATYDRRRGSVRTWMYQIARNAVIDRRRRASVRPGLHALATHEDSEPGALDQSIEQIALRSQVTAALARLTPEHRDVLSLAHYEGMTAREIAQTKDVPIGTIKSRTWYAMRNLRRAFQETEVVLA